LAYRAPLAAFWWFSPILPHLSWGIEALLGVMVPSLGFFAINLYVHPMALRRLGISAEPRGFGKPRESARGLIALSIACVLMVWASTGLLGVQPTAILSGSMRPSMDVGDMAIVRQVPADSIEVGDVIQFWGGSEMVIHRVVEVYRGEGGRLFVTKGDANNEPDPLPVRPEQVRGKVILTLPKVGWAAIAVKEFAVRAWSFASSNPLPLALVAVGLCAAYALRSRSSRRWRASGFRRARGGGRLALPLSLLLIATAASGFAYSHWSETLFIEGTVTTGKWYTHIGSYKIRVPRGIEVEDRLSPDNRTLGLTCDDVFESWYCWIGLVIPNDGSMPIGVLRPAVEFSPGEAADDIQVEMYFYGPFSRGDFTDVYAHVKLPPLGPNDIAPPPPGDVPPPIALDPGQKAVIWIKVQSKASIGPLQIYVTVREGPIT
ncbi:MAG: signal peptidase I, partial [Hadesarchaea archaeon]|nr:signal peptidase I [Hadesarchaea archaeon]